MDKLADQGSDALLSRIEEDAFGYFLRDEKDAIPGLTPDTSEPKSDCSVAAAGFALASLAAGAERGFLPRQYAVKRALLTLRFFARSEQSDSPTATGFRGFYFHFLDRRTGRRADRCELSSIDTALLIAGALVAGRYFDGQSEGEREVRTLADTLYRRVEWDWICDNGLSASLGWTPERGFLRYHWQGYNEGLLLYLLALGSPTHPIPLHSYREWTSTYNWRSLYGQSYLYAGPLFIHHFPHCFLDFRGIQDEFMRAHDSDYFENSRRAVFVQRDYARRNPRKFAGYGEDLWGISACDGPGPARRLVDGRERSFSGYRARGVPNGPDDGTLAPCSAIASLPFAPDQVLPLIYNLKRLGYCERDSDGFGKTINLTFPAGAGKSGERGWISARTYGIAQGPVVLMLENHRSDLVWRLMRGCPYVVEGLRRAGFTGGWLDSDAQATSGERERLHYA
jgi:hypothetical protein